MNPTFTLSELTVEDANIILGALNELPRKVSNNLILKLESQLQSQSEAYNQQMQASQAPAPEVVQ